MANARLQEANTMLAAVQQKVAELNAEVQALEAQFAAAVDDKNAAIRESERCQLKLQLANRLISALASEGGGFELTKHLCGPALTGLFAAAFSALSSGLPNSPTPIAQANAGHGPLSSCGPATTYSRATCCLQGAVCEGLRCRTAAIG
jgi:hypothetical protein